MREILIMDFQSSSSSATFPQNTSNTISSPVPAIGTTKVSATPANNSTKQIQQCVQRKRQPPSAVSLMRRKKIKTTIIDCPVAIILLKELGLNRSFFNSGTVLAWALEPTDPAFMRIHDYVYRGQQQGPRIRNFRNFGAKVLGILQIMTKVDNLQDALILSDFNEDPVNTGQLRKMLWHGTNTTNVAKILQNGLKLPKHNCRNLFGKGIYFADRVDLSLCFCKDWRNNINSGFEAGNKAYLFLCDVLLGNDLYKTRQIFGIRHGKQINLNWPWQASKIFTINNIMGTGLWGPDPKQDQIIDGCVWPMGEGITIDKGSYLDRNIYTVFDEMRVIPKYLVKVEFTQNPVSEKVH